MSASQDIIDNVKQVRSATYGKDVREAIATGLELCYKYTSGETAIEAAERANAAAAAVEQVIGSAEETLEDLQRAVANVDDIVKVSEDQPTEPENKIWIQTQSDTEYKVASFAAYEALWNRMNEVDEVYQQGHGGVVSIVEDEEYEDPDDTGLRRRYIITYSDGTTSEFFVNDGPAGPVGPLDQVEGTAIYYHKGILENGVLVQTPPDDGWSSTIPQDMAAGDYLWTQTIVTYESTKEAYIYGLTFWGLNGSGAVNSVKLGANGSALTGDIVLPVDSAPTQNSGNIVSSGGVYAALQNYAGKSSPAFTGTPTAPTPPEGDSSTKIATTDFVMNALGSGSGNGMSAKVIEISISAPGYMSFRDSFITANTYCLFTVPSTAPISNVNKYFNRLQWSTATGTLYVYIDVASGQVSEPYTLQVVLIDLTDYIG